MATRRFTKVRNQNRRNTKGSSLMELAAVMTFFPLVAFITVNLGVVCFAAGISDAACKDAARAAAQRSTLADAIDAAQAICGRYNAFGIFGKPEVITDACKFDIQADAEGNPQIGGTATSQGGPYVTIATKTVIQLPAPMIFNGQSLTSQMTFGSSCTFPILNPAPSNDDSEIVVSNGPDEQANAASAAEDRLAEIAEAASEKAAVSAAAAEYLDGLAATAAASAATYDAQYAAAAAAAAANPSDAGLAATAQAAGVAAGQADAASAAAAKAASDADATAASDAAAAVSAEQAVDAAADAVLAAYDHPPQEDKVSTNNANDD